MSDETQVSVNVTASTTGLQQGMQQGVQSVNDGAAGMRNGLNSVGGATNSLADRFKSFLGSIQSSMGGASAASSSGTAAIAGHFNSLTGQVGGAVSGLQGQLGGLSKAFGFLSSNFAALAALAAGVGVFKEGISASKQFTGEAMGLSKALGISATDAATFNVALGEVGLTSENVTAAASGLARQLRTNEEGLNKMGLVTRDANHNLIDSKTLLLDSVKVLGSYKEGFDRTQAGQVLFRGAIADATGLMKLNNKVLEEAKKKQEELGLTVTENNVESMKEYKKSMIDVGDVMLALKKTIGDAVMPIFAQFGQWLSSIGPAAVFVLKGAVDGLAATFWFLRNGVVTVWEVIKAGLFTLTEPFVKFGSAIYKAMTGDIKGALADVNSITGNMAAAWDKAFQNIGDSADLTRKRVADLFLPGKATQATDNSKKKAFVDPNPAPTKPPQDRMKGFEAELLELKTKYMQENDMREMSLQDEAAFWEKKKLLVGAGAKEAGAIQKMIAATNFADEKRIAKQRQDLEQEVADHQMKVDLASVDAAQEMDAQRLALGQETALESIQMEQQFETQRYNIQKQALQDRLELLSKDPTTNLVERQKILDQLLQMEQKHANDSAKIQNKAALETKKPYLDLSSSIGQSFKQNLSSLLQGTTTFAGAIKGLLTGVMGAFADMVADMAAKWLMTQITNRIVQTSTGVATVMSNAAVAASAAFASTAAIPIIGPEMAPGAAAAAYSATAAFAPMASARNGFDIPAGLNPVTQLHEKEMVLPAKQADAVRQMADGKGGAGGGDIHIHAIDAKGIEKFLKSNGRHLVGALQDQARKFAGKG